MNLLTLVFVLTCRVEFCTYMGQYGCLLDNVQTIHVIHRMYRKIYTELNLESAVLWDTLYKNLITHNKFKY